MATTFELRHPREILSSSFTLYDKNDDEFIFSEIVRRGTNILSGMVQSDKGATILRFKGILDPQGRQLKITRGFTEESLDTGTIVMENIPAEDLLKFSFDKDIALSPDNWNKPFVRHYFDVSKEAIQDFISSDDDEIVFMGCVNQSAPSNVQSLYDVYFSYKKSDQTLRRSFGKVSHGLGV